MRCKKPGNPGCFNVLFFLSMEIHGQEKKPSFLQTFQKFMDSEWKYRDIIKRQTGILGLSGISSYLQPESRKYLDFPEFTDGMFDHQLSDQSSSSSSGTGSIKGSDLFTDWMSDPELNDQSITAETEPANISFSQQRDRLECKLCGKDEDSAFLSMPVITGLVYRLELQSAGLFRCSKTGIKFQVTCPVTIEYELVPWSNYASLIQNLHNGFELLGTLFNIKTDLKPHVVSAVYLPHCLCLKGFKEDISCIKCAHFKDDNLTLETPTRVEPYYVVLENPTFSPIGSILLYPFMWIKDKITTLIPFHGMVLIYWKISGITDPEYRKFRIHLYLMPCDQSVEMDIDNQKKKLGFDRIHKPHQTDVLYNRRTYDVKASQNARVLPKTLLFRCSYIMELYPYTEITVGDKETNELIVMSVEDGESSVWQAEVDKGDINDLVTAFTGLLRSEVPMESVDEVQAMPIEVSMECGRRSCLDLLNEVLGNISEKSFLAFKAYLNEQVIVKPFQTIPQSHLESAGCIEVAKLLIRYYTEEKAPNVTITVLEAIKEVNNAKKLR
ncbi:NACHT, LRR and PYD domains-containing protein 1b allele 3-like [Mantella aurantiaca]